MTSNENVDSIQPMSAPTRLRSEEIIRQLQQFPVEVLEAALLAQQLCQARPNT